MCGRPTLSRRDVWWPVSAKTRRRRNPSGRPFIVFYQGGTTSLVAQTRKQPQIVAIRMIPLAARLDELRETQFFERELKHARGAPPRSLNCAPTPSPRRTWRPLAVLWVHQYPDGKPHARAMVPLRDGVWFCNSCGKILSSASASGVRGTSPAKKQCGPKNL